MPSSQNAETPSRQPAYHGVSYRHERVRIRKRFSNLDDPKVSRAYEQACEEQLEALENGERDPVNQRVPAFYLATIFLNGKVRYLGCAQTAIEAARLFDAALYHLWGFRQRKRSQFNFYKQGDSAPEFSEHLRKLRNRLKRELEREPRYDKGTALSPENFDFNFNNEQNP